MEGGGLLHLQTSLQVQFEDREMCPGRTVEVMERRPSLRPSSLGLQQLTDQLPNLDSLSVSEKTGNLYIFVAAACDGEPVFFLSSSFSSLIGAARSDVRGSGRRPAAKLS